MTTSKAVLHFSSLTGAARHFGLNPKMVSNRVHTLGWTLQQALELESRPPQKAHRGLPVKVRTPSGERTFDCMKDAAIFFGIKPATVRARLHAFGWTAEQALGLLPPPTGRTAHNAQPVRIKAGAKSYEYPSVSAAAKARGISEFLVFNRMRRGWTLAQALEIEAPSEHAKKCYGYIYVVTHTTSGQQYVGQTMKPVTERWLDHQKSATKGSRRPLPAAIRKYGAHAFSVEQVASTRSYDDANRLEREWIAQLGTQLPNGFNITRGGGGLSLGRAITVAGTKYRSIAIASREYGLRPSLVTERLGRGWTIGQAFGLEAEPETVWSRGRPLTVLVKEKPITFKSLQAASRHFGVPPGTVEQRVAACGWSIEEALGLVEPTSRWARKALTLVIQGEQRTFRSARQAAEFMGIDERLVYGRLQNGWSIEEALETTKRKKPKPIGKRCVVV